MSDTPKYADRDPEELEPYYTQHVVAMTKEGLHSKSAIAAELAYRDAKISNRRDEIIAVVERMKKPTNCDDYSKSMAS